MYILYVYVYTTHLHIHGWIGIDVDYRYYLYGCSSYWLHQIILRETMGWAAQYEVGLLGCGSSEATFPDIPIVFPYHSGFKQSPIISGSLRHIYLYIQYNVFVYIYIYIYIYILYIYIYIYTVHIYIYICMQYTMYIDSSSFHMLPLDFPKTRSQEQSMKSSHQLAMQLAQKAELGITVHAAESGPGRRCYGVDMGYMGYMGYSTVTLQT